MTRGRTQRTEPRRPKPLPSPLIRSLKTQSRPAPFFAGTCCWCLSWGFYFCSQLLDWSWLSESRSSRLLRGALQTSESEGPSRDMIGGARSALPLNALSRAFASGMLQRPGVRRS